ncbi:aspartate carbamoyltransferase [Sulfolobales archaeon HS-7]|nr:aspartate carbamoyltransferase [Sulfolobales archaeon HS-7]
MDLISIEELDRAKIDEIFVLSNKFREGYKSDLPNRIVALAFFEPSTRTYSSFESAAKRLDVKVIGFRGEQGISTSKGETFSDTIRMLDAYADAIVVRHKYEGAAKLAAEVAKKPVINAGDGRNEHPTQALVDFYTILEEKGKINDLNYGIVGDLKYGRTVNSFLLMLNKFSPGKVYLISPPELRARKEILDRLNFNIEEIDELEVNINRIDVLYVIRIQKERYLDAAEYQKVKGSYRITKRIAENMKKDAIILHPLPRVDEIDREVDKTENAKYFIQAQYGIPVRMSILTLILGDSYE